MKSGSGFLMIWWLLLIAGGACWAVLAVQGEPTVWRGLLVSFHYIVPLAAGLVTWSAIAVTCRGKWMKGYEAPSLAARYFSVPAVLLALLLWAGVPAWSPWHIEDLHQGKWLHDNVVMSRTLGVLVLFWGLAHVYTTKRRTGSAGVMAPWFVVVYAIAFSMIGFDLIMALDPHWYSTLAGGYYFMTGLYLAVACWILYAAVAPDFDADSLHDLGNALLGFCLFSTYLMYSNLLPIWYENLPEEARFIAPRIFAGAWGETGRTLIAWIYLGPLVLLLWKNGKKKRWYMVFVALWVLSGMWVERWWLVAPTLDPQAVPTLADVAAAALAIGLFGIVMNYGLRKSPHERTS